MIKANVTTLFDPCQTFWRGVYARSAEKNRSSQINSRSPCERALHILIHLFLLDYKPANNGPKNYVVFRPDDLNLIKEEQKRSDGKYDSFT